MDYTFEHLLVDVEDGVALITLNRPEKLNPLDKPIMNALAAVFMRMRVDPDVRAVVLTGAGRAFCAGGDVSGMADYFAGTGDDGFLPQNAIEARMASKDFVLSIQGFEKPIIAAVNGIAAGGGASLILLSDVVYASERASFCIVFPRIGLIPDMGTQWLLPQAVGPNNAKYLTFSTDMIDAQEMHRLGLAQKILPTDELVSAALAFAKKLANGPTLALTTAKSIINRAGSLSIEQFFELEAFALPTIVKSDDFREGVMAFIEKRPAVFKGR